MTNQASPEAFELRYDFTDIPDDSYDAVLNKFPGHEKLKLDLIVKDPEALPNEVWFWASLERVRALDFLKVDVEWAVCSKRFLAAIEGVGDFPHVAIPAHFAEASDKSEATLEDEYVVLAIPKATDALDRENSEIEYEPDGSILIIKKWRFKEPLPPLFKVKEDRAMLLITRRTKEELEKHSFRRIQILPQERIGLL